MLILIANVEMRSLTGTVIVVRDLALSLRRRGHKVVVYAPILGEPAHDLWQHGISTIDRLDRWNEIPDVIHGHHNLPTILAMTRFPGTPAIWVKHGRGDWFDSPPRSRGSIATWQWIRSAATC